MVIEQKIDPEGEKEAVETIIAGLGEETAVEPQVVTTAVVRIAPGKDSAVVKLLGDIMRIRDWATKLVIASENDAKMATNDLSIMAKLKKAVEDKRQEYVGPLNAHVKAVNDALPFASDGQAPNEVIYCPYSGGARC